jgi:uncharacterized protein YgbK (DUF1537 family)
MTPSNSRHPNMPYVIFPGNVGDENALLETWRILTGDLDEKD